MTQRKLKVGMAFRGTAYHGYQRQDNASSVQETVECALTKLLKEQVTIFGCSRTDAGVHASSFCFHLVTANRIPCEGFVRGLNTLLPGDIAIQSCEEAPEDFHARFDAKGKEYIYKIWTGERNPFLENLALHHPFPVDVELLQTAAESLVGEHDFAAFCGASSTVKSTVRTIYGIQVRREGKMVEISVCGNGFLYNMVRIVAGTLLYVGEGKIAPGELPGILASRDRTRAGITAPPHGLYLNRVWY